MAKTREKTKGLRTCVACRNIALKKEFVTFKSKEGKLVIDEKGDIPGRGMNLCKKIECYDLAVKKGLFKKIGNVEEIPNELKDQFTKCVKSPTRKASAN